MTSTNTYSPYFYIIQHKLSKKMYAGSRWAKRCHPNEFMTKNGYTTSSPTINSIIEQEGLDSFIILHIDTNLDNLSAYDYESLFLQTLDCSNSDEWYNGHNNSGIAFGTDYFKKIMLEIYGVDHNTHIPESLERQKQTRYERTGFDYPMQNPDVQEQCRRNNKKRTGFDYPAQNPESLERRKQTNREKYGVDHVLQNEKVKEKGKQTRLHKNNGKYHSIEELEKSKKTNRERTGFDYPMQNLETQEKSKKTNREKFGVDNPMQNSEIQEKATATKRKLLLEKFGCNSEQEIIKKMYYFEKLYNIEKDRNNNPNLSIIIKYFPKSAHKSITTFRIIFKGSHNIPKSKLIPELK